MHFLQTTKNDEEDKIPSNHLAEEQNPQKQFNIKLVRNIWNVKASHLLHIVFKLWKAGVGAHHEIQTHILPV